MADHKHKWDRDGMCTLADCNAMTLAKQPLVPEHEHMWLANGLCDQRGCFVTRDSAWPQQTKVQPDTQPSTDYKALAEGIEQMRENISALVAGFKGDGFTDEQARDIVAGMFRLAGTKGADQ